MSAQHKTEAEKLQDRGIERANAHNLQGEIELWQKALTIYQKVGEKEGEGNALSNIALAHHFLGDYQQALTYHQQSLAVDMEIIATKKEEFLVTSKFDNYQFGEYISRQQIGTPNSLNYLRFNLGFTYYWLNDYARAIKQYEFSLAIVRESKDIYIQNIISNPYNNCIRI
jgi:tetratricopeptide (TPR) repeat protein